MLAAGFADVQLTRQAKRTQESPTRFLAYARQRHRISQLLAISDEDYEAGIQRLERQIGQEGESAIVESQSCLVTIRGDKPLAEPSVPTTRR